jgi:SAM-dependent methyltransferase
MDNLQTARREFLNNTVKLEADLTGIEIGPFTRPTLFPEEVNIDYSDYYTTEELKAQARNLNIPEETVLDVSYVTKNTELFDLLEKESVDFIIANHVLEHLIDPFKWLKNLEFALKPGGFFFIALPDKRMSFDKFRPDTNLAHFIEDFISGGERSIAEHSIEAALYYDQTYVGAENHVHHRLNSSFILNERNGYHPGMHVHVFQAGNFLNNVLLPFLEIGWLNLSLKSFEFNISDGEFYFILEKKENSKQLEPSQFFKKAYDSMPITEVKA